MRRKEHEKKLQTCKEGVADRGGRTQVARVLLQPRLPSRACLRDAAMWAGWMDARCGESRWMGRWGDAARRGCCGRLPPSSARVRGGSAPGPDQTPMRLPPPARGARCCGEAVGRSGWKLENEMSLSCPGGGGVARSRARDRSRVNAIQKKKEMEEMRRTLPGPRSCPVGLAHGAACSSCAYLRGGLRMSGTLCPISSKLP
jgi:hypothetical protein